MVIMDIIVTVIALTSATASLLISDGHMYVFLLSIDIIPAVYLIFTVISMRRAVLSMNITQPNDKLVLLHVFNFCGVIVLFVTFILMLIYEMPLQVICVVADASILFTGYSNCFLIYLVLRFVKENN